MKKILTLALVALLVISMIVPAYAADAILMVTVPAGKQNVVAGKPVEYVSQMNNGKIFNQLTDGIIVSSGIKNKHILNTPHCANDAEAVASRAIAFTVDGEQKNYLYALKIATSTATVDSFQVTWTGENCASANKNLDTKIEILISTDNGATYTSAFENTTDCFGQDGQVDVEYEGLLYNITTANLKQEYTGVTTIVYAVKEPRLNTSRQDYPARISEMSFFGNTAAPDTGDNTVVLTVAAVTALLGAAYVTKKKLFN